MRSVPLLLLVVIVSCDLVEGSAWWNIIFPKFNNNNQSKEYTGLDLESFVKQGMDKSTKTHLSFSKRNKDDEDDDHFFSLKSEADYEYEDKTEDDLKPIGNESQEHSQPEEQDNQTTVEFK